MKGFRKSLAVLLLSGGAVVGWVFGTDLVQNVRFAQAKEQVEATREQLASVEDLSSVFRSVGKVVEPSVVQITVRKKAGGSQLPFGEDQLKRLFPDRDGDGEPDLPENFRIPRMPEGGFTQGTGSGVIMEVSGKTAYVITNNHVAGDAVELTVTLADGRRIENGKVLGADAKTDLAVLQIEAERVIAAKWGDSDTLEKGDWIMAFGSPFGYIGSMTHGIVSALNRQAGILGQQGYENFIQVDAPINPGNSGGPLVNTRGEVVGINTAIASQNGGFQGIGFAIPSNQVKFVYAALKEKGKVTRGWLGVEIADVGRLPQALRNNLSYKGDTGILVRGTFRNTPAFGKLQPDDVIVALNGKPVTTVQDLRNTIAATAPGAEVTMRVVRDGKEQDVAVTIGEQPDDLSVVASGGKPAPGAPGQNTAEALGMTLTAPTEALAQKYGLEPNNLAGAVVTAVAPDSPAAQAGVQEGDLITKVGDADVKTAKDVSDALSKEDSQKGVSLHITNRAGTRSVFIEAPKS